MIRDKFIYVFSKEDRDKLFFQGFVLLNEDKYNNIFVFLNEGDMTFDSSDIEYVLSNKLTF